MDVGVFDKILIYDLFQDHIRMELSTFERYVFFPGSKISLNARKYKDQTSESIEIYLETNESGPDTFECDLRPSSNMTRNNIKWNPENEPNGCNKYMIYGRKIIMEDPKGPFGPAPKSISHFYIEPFYFFYWHFDRKHRSLIFKEESFVYGGPSTRTVATYTTFADVVRILRGRDTGAVEIFTLASNKYQEEHNIHANVTFLYPFPSEYPEHNRSPFGVFDVGFDNSANTCSSKLIYTGRRGIEEKIYDVKLYNFGFGHIISNYIEKIVHKYSEYSFPSIIRLDEWFPRNSNYKIRI